MSDEYLFVGGDLCLDFANTTDWRLGPNPSDRITDAEDLKRWAIAAGILERSSPLHASCSGSDFAAALSLREALQSVFPIAAVPACEVELDTIKEAYCDALRRWQIRMTPHGATLAAPTDIGVLQQVRDAVALSAYQLLTSVDAGKVRLCGNGGCGWLFLDRSRNGRRRWCSSPGCGNAARVRRHRQRLRSGPISGLLESS